MHRQIAGRLTGRVTKWFVLAFWLVIVVVSSTFAAKLTDVVNNEASSWLPASAESTKALEKLGPFQDPNAIPTLVVYERDVRPDRGRHRRRRPRTSQEFATLERRGGRDPGPVPVRGRPGAADGGDLQLRSRRLERHARRGRRPARHRLARRRRNVYIAGAGGQAADAAEAFAGIDTNLLFATLAVVIIILLFTYRSPILWILPIFCAGVALFTSQAHHLLPREVRRPDRQRAEPGDPDHPGDRRRDRLRAAAGGAISRGAAPARGPARGDGLRAAPRRPGRRWRAPRPWS